MSTIARATASLAWSALGQRVTRSHSVLGNASPTALSEVTQPFAFPRDNLPVQRGGEFENHINGWVLCHKWHCSIRDCSDAPKSSTVHYDCFKIFKQTARSKEALNRLWVAASWRKPWRQNGGPPTPFLLPEPISITRPVLIEIARKFDVVRMFALPYEILYMIQRYSEESLFWRFAAATDLATRINRLPIDTLSTLPIANIRSWVRGTPADLFNSAEDFQQESIIRLIIDSRGIRQIERVSKVEPVSIRTRSFDLAYVVQPESQLEDVAFQFKVSEILRGNLFLELT